jgi:Fe-S oxidoreductase
MASQCGEVLALVREIKRVCDSKGILNAGMVLGPDPSRPAWPFRTLPAATRQPLLLAEAAKCNSCGDCRTQQSPARMCPAFRGLGSESASPRGMVQAVRAALDADDGLTSDALHRVAKACVQCQQCRQECPAGVDVPHLMNQVKAAHYAARGFDRGEWLLARSERLSGISAVFALTSNILLGSQAARWLLEKCFGLARKRLVHRFTHRTFLRRRFVQRLYRRLPSNPRKLAYFVDAFANVNDPLLAEATVAVLEHHGFAVHVPRRQWPSGLAALQAGDVETARARAGANVATLAELVRDGYTVICSEPSAALAITLEYPRLLNDDDSQLVAANTRELMAFLGNLQSKGLLKPTTHRVDIAIAHHVPCHVKSQGAAPAAELLGRVQGLAVTAVEAGCSGAAGKWGMAAANFETSLQIGAPLFAAIQASRATHATSECSACRMQIQQGTGRRALHPVQVLALAYGLVPQLQKRLSRPVKPLLSA